MVIPLGAIALCLVGAIKWRWLLGPKPRLLVSVTLGQSLLLFAGEPFVKFLPLLLYPLLCAGLESLLRDEVPAGLRWASVGILALALNYLAVPLLRAAATLVQWNQRSEAPIVAMVRAHVPPGSDVVSYPQGFYAVVGSGSRYICAGPLFGLRIAPTPDDRAQFASDLTRVKPRYILVPTAIRPEREYGYLRATRFSLLARYVEKHLRFGPIVKQGYDLALWKVVY